MFWEMWVEEVRWGVERGNDRRCQNNSNLPLGSALARVTRWPLQALWVWCFGDLS